MTVLDDIQDVSIHASRVGRDIEIQGPRVDWRGFNPRVPCGTRRIGQFAPTVSIDVSIHASRVGRDMRFANQTSLMRRFNPRVPCGTRPGENAEIDGEQYVSIHASRVGRDLRRWLGGTSGSVSIHASRVGRDSGGLSACLRLT